MPEAISLPKALARGFSMKCPNCGRAHLFGRFLKVVDYCAVCEEDYTPQRADDFPAYLVIVVVGHLVVPGLLAVAIAYDPPVWLQLAIWLPITLFARSDCCSRPRARSSRCNGRPGCTGSSNRSGGGEALHPPVAAPARVAVRN